MILAFTGHRPNKLGGYGGPNATLMRMRVKLAIYNKLRELQPGHCISGMALGVDQWAAQACVLAGIPFTAAVPFRGQEQLWPPKSQEMYRVLLSRAAKVEVVTDGQLEASKAMQLRNEWMVDHSDMVLAIWDGSKGGTANCVRFAKLVGKTVIRINPKELR